jgi:hypothetical protein
MGHPVIVDINKAIKSFGLEIDMPDADHAPYVADTNTTAGADTCSLCGRKFRGESVIVVPSLVSKVMKGKDESRSTRKGYLCLNLKDCVARASTARSEKEQSLASKLNTLQQKVILP